MSTPWEILSVRKPERPKGAASPALAPRPTKAAPRPVEVFPDTQTKPAAEIRADSLQKIKAALQQGRNAVSKVAEARRWFESRIARLQTANRTADKPAPAALLAASPSVPILIAPAPALPVLIVTPPQEVAPPTPAVPAALKAPDDVTLTRMPLTNQQRLTAKRPTSPKAGSARRRPEAFTSPPAPAAAPATPEADVVSPVSVVPGAQEISRDSVLVFSTGNGNRIAVGDGDSRSGFVWIRVAAQKGSVRLAGADHLTFETGGAGESLLVECHGPVHAVNAALEGLRFRPFPGHVGAASLQIVAHDARRRGRGPLIANVSIPIKIRQREVLCFRAAGMATPWQELGDTAYEGGQRDAIGEDREEDSG